MKRIVVDSSASLYALDGIDFAAMPLKIVTDEREYLDDGTLDAVEMATTLRTYKGKTSTSCPNIGDWLEAYEGADEIYAITITGTLSGSCNAAQLAAEEYQAEHPGAQVFVLDSLSAGPELVLLAEHIRALIEEGRDFDEVCEEMLRYRHHTHLLFSLESLANLARNGQVKPLWPLWRGCSISGSSAKPAMWELDVLCKTRAWSTAPQAHRAGRLKATATNGKVIICPLRQSRPAERLMHMVRAVFEGGTGAGDRVRRPVQLLRRAGRPHGGLRGRGRLSLKSPYLCAILFP